MVFSEWDGQESGNEDDAEFCRRAQHHGNNATEALHKRNKTHPGKPLVQLKEKPAVVVKSILKTGTSSRRVVTTSGTLSVFQNHRVAMRQ